MARGAAKAKTQGSPGQQQAAARSRGRGADRGGPPSKRQAPGQERETAAGHRDSAELGVKQQAAAGLGGVNGGRQGQQQAQVNIDASRLFCFMACYGMACVFRKNPDSCMPHTIPPLALPHTHLITRPPRPPPPTWPPGPPPRPSSRSFVPNRDVEEACFGGEAAQGVAQGGGTYWPRGPWRGRIICVYRDRW